ncbi:hypothetical protein jhhlp_003932 [Lomentospora prolificans]|uniref:ATP-grasp domain-containing protein n=1 Tax=Lomentospora prolificans TaxID=41688 RepID=A0A2N3NA48_9PEZI|nr:hypothetical protein jhhlp_003932 [Lomentospora prolificans]
MSPHIPPDQLGQIILKAIGGIQVLSTASPDAIDRELEDRLSFPWLVLEKVEVRRIAWVQGREDIDCIARALEAAYTLGIKLVVLDDAGHWLEDPDSDWAYLREDFIPVDITPDTGLAERIVDAVRSYPRPIEGIVTISDVRLAAVAKACQILHLPTESPEAYEIAGDKGRTRLLETVGAGESFVLQKAEDLGPYLDNRRKDGQEPLRYPMVVKPVIGWCSDCVSKVHNESELEIAVRKASDRHAESANPSTVVVVEPYVDGPEVDANFALLDGEIVFCDINDDFPSPADVPGADYTANFQETQNVMPSALPEKEQAAIKEQLLQSMLRQGFRSGLFHCEARVRNSTMMYREIDGIIDLIQRPDPPRGEPQIYLHEVNARPAGYLESVAVLLTYGVDYYALRMLLSLGPPEYPRFRALAQPFRRGPQFHLSVMIIQQTKAGIMRSADAAKEFLTKHPEVQKNVVDYYSRKKAGDILEGPDASALWWVAFLSVISRESRRDLLQTVDFVQRNFEYEMEEVK